MKKPVIGTKSVCKLCGERITWDYWTDGLYEVWVVRNTQKSICNKALIKPMPFNPQWGDGHWHEPSEVFNVSQILERYE